MTKLNKNHTILPLCADENKMAAVPRLLRVMPQILLSSLPTVANLFAIIFVCAGEPEAHQLAGGGHHHVPGAELDALDGVLVVAVQRTHLKQTNNNSGTRIIVVFLRNFLRMNNNFRSFSFVVCLQFPETTEKPQSSFSMFKVWTTNKTKNIYF